MKWVSEKTVLGWIVVFETPQGFIWFQPDTHGNIRCAFNTLPGLTVDLRAITAIAETVKAQYPVKRFGNRGGLERGEFCEKLFAALNKAKLFPARKDAA